MVITIFLFYYKAMTVQRYVSSFLGSQILLALSSNGYDIVLFPIGLRPEHIFVLQTWLIPFVLPKNEAKCLERTQSVEKHSGQLT